MKRVAIGQSDFRNLILNGCYYIDKTMYIKEVIDDVSSVALITRPRRFGKTLNMSMLRYYFDCNVENSKELFNGLKIMDQGEKYTEKQGAYPCIYLTLKDVKSSSYEEMLGALRIVMSNLYSEHMYLLESGKIHQFEKDKITDILYEREEVETLKTSIQTLAKYLKRHFGKEVMLLVDEYDVPLQNAYVEGYYDEAVKFYREFYGTTFKDNSNLAKTVVTGVSRIAKESIFSGANNFKVYTVLNNEFADDFGITESEMDKIIKDFEVQDEKEEIKKWYDGYRIGNVEGIYNPWSIINYLADRRLAPYWVNTSSNDLIKLILKNSVTVKERIERLLNDEEIEVIINEETIINGIENNEDNIWGLMLGTGYLKVIEETNFGMYKVAIPNYEIKMMFKIIIRDWFSNKVIYNNLYTILKDLVELNLEEFEYKFEELVKSMFSYMDVGEKTAENFYHAFVLGMLVGLEDSYYIRSNRESGIGRYDIMLEPKDKNKNAFIMEFKLYRENKEKTIEETVENAKKQIEEKEYEQELRDRGFANITKMVFAFKRKRGNT